MSPPNQSNNASGIGITDPNEFARRPTTAAPTFNPYDALGIPAATYTRDEISAAFRRAHMHLGRATATPSFPSRVDINVAREYLVEVTARRVGRQNAVAATWSSRPRTFFAERGLGGTDVFEAAATPTATPSRSRPTPPPRRSRSPLRTPPNRPPPQNPYSGEGNFSGYTSRTRTPPPGSS
jgi:hypothetical protein